MAVKCEVIAVDGQKLTIAYYYPIDVADQLPAAVDANRVPAGSALSAQEIQDLKDGKIYEQLEVYEVPFGTPIATIAGKVQQRWNNGQDAALEEYKARYSFSSQVGRWWDGNVWH